MKFKLYDKVYDGGALDELSLKLILQLEKETAEFGRPLNISDVQSMSNSVQALKTDAERAAHPDVMWLTAISIWAARKIAGDQVTFDQAIDFPLTALTILPEPQDHKQPDPTRARARKGSGPAVKRQPAAHTRT